MQKHDRPTPIPSFYSDPWSHTVTSPSPPTPLPYFHPNFQVQRQQVDLYNGQRNVGSYPPHYDSTASPQDHMYDPSNYGMRQPETARYPESSQRTHLDETSRSAELPPSIVRGLERNGTILPIDGSEVEGPTDCSFGCESPAVDCEADNFPLEGQQPSHFHQPTPQVPLTSATFLPNDDAVQFPYQFYQNQQIDASPVNSPSAGEVSSFVDPIEPTTTGFDSDILSSTGPSRTSSTLPSYHAQNPQPPIISFQMRSLTVAPVAAEEPIRHASLPSFGSSNNDSMNYHSPNDTEYGCNSAHIETPPPLSPLSPTGLRTHWSGSSLSSAFKENPNGMAQSESNSPPPVSNSGSESSEHRRSMSVVASNAPLAAPPHLNSPRRRVKKKKKSKMHQCTLCDKQFPRPSGLTTHQNSHSGTKPFKCEYRGCEKSFTVRSNAKRHLRTHGIYPDPTEQVPGPCFAGFNPPIVSHVQHQLFRATPNLKLKWMPQSLSTRTNAAALKSSSDSGSELDEKDDGCVYGATSLRPIVSTPLPPVVPSSPALQLGDNYEERNSFAEAGSQPYHPTQWGVLPGPAVLRTQAAV